MPDGDRMFVVARWTLRYPTWPTSVMPTAEATLDEATAEAARCLASARARNRPDWFTVHELSWPPVATVGDPAAEPD